MPRTLSRLRFRPNVAKPLHFVGPSGAPRFSEEILQQKATAYVVRQSNPRNLRLALVVNHRSQRQPTGKHVTPPRKPFTLRDVVDPESKAQHGEIIYVFRHIRTNQIIYSLQELMSDHHLEQLPFLGKRSKPAAIRPDEWTPHCVISFPTAEQGHNAFRRLREFRKLHEYAWEKQNPEWKHMSHKNRMKKIMNQRANMVADLAEVLRLQEVQAKLMARTFESRELLVKKHIRRRWSAIQKQAKATGKDMNNPKWVEHRIHMVERKMKMKHKQNPKDQEELEKAKAHYEDRLAKLQRDNKRIEALQSFEEELAKKREPALEAGARERLAEMQREADSLTKAIANPDPLRSESELAEDAERAVSLMNEIKELEEAFEADAQLESKDHPVMRSVLPANRKLDLQKSFRAPFNLQDVRIRWADIQDALYARGQWPEIIEHETLDVYAAREKTTLLSYEDYQVEMQNEVASVMDLLRVKGAIHEAESEPEYVSQEQQSSILPLLPNGGKVFNNAPA